MKGIPIIPGVPGAGHTARNGYWHPGRPEGCVKCEPEAPPRRTRRDGSDCRTGKIQYASRDAALDAARALKAPTLRPFRCAWCQCWHNGNSRGHASKARAR